jgi:hypothetical protein
LKIALDLFLAEAKVGGVIQDDAVNYCFAVSDIFHSGNMFSKLAFDSPGLDSGLGAEVYLLNFG